MSLKSNKCRVVDYLYVKDDYVAYEDLASGEQLKPMLAKEYLFTASKVIKFTPEYTFYCSRCSALSPRWICDKCYNEICH